MCEAGTPGALWRIETRPTNFGTAGYSAAGAVPQKRRRQEVEDVIAERPLTAEDHVQAYRRSGDHVGERANPHDPRDDHDNPQARFTRSGQEPDHGRDEKAGVDRSREVRRESRIDRVLADLRERRLDV